MADVQCEGFEMLAEVFCKLHRDRIPNLYFFLVGSENASAIDFKADTSRRPMTNALLGISKKHVLPSEQSPIIITGRVAYSAVPEYCSCVDICAFPRRSQLVGEILSPIKPPIEAAALGKAAVMSNVGVIQEVLDEQSLICFMLGSIRELMDRITFFRHNRLRRKEYKEYNERIKNCDFVNGSSLVLRQGWKLTIKSASRKAEQPKQSLT